MLDASRNWSVTSNSFTSISGYTLPIHFGLENRTVETELLHCKQKILLQNNYYFQENQVVKTGLKTLIFTCRNKGFCFKNICLLFSFGCDGVVHGYRHRCEIQSRRRGPESQHPPGSVGVYVLRRLSVLTPAANWPADGQFVASSLLPAIPLRLRITLPSTGAAGCDTY